MRATSVMPRIGSYFLGIILGAVFGGVVGHFQPVWWEGRALILLGDFTESKQTVVTRLRTDSFKEAVKAHVGIVAKTSFAVSVTPELSNSDSVVIVTAKAESEDAAQRTTETIVTELQQRHEKLQQCWLDASKVKQSALLAAMARSKGSFIVSVESFSEPIVRPTQLLEKVSVREVGWLIPVWRAWMFGALLGLLISWAWGRGFRTWIASCWTVSCSKDND